LVFNRPETTRQVFDAVRQAQPPKLYVAADGPRDGRRDENERCEEVRRIATAVDWPCEVKTFFRDKNQGCKMGVSSGISWFFGQESEGIILEDDVLPVLSFFEFCDELLERYRNDERVVAVSGSNLISDIFTSKSSYFFSRYNSIWGWATWRRAWRHYDVAMTDWPAWRNSNGLAKMPGANYLFEDYWRRVLDTVHEGKVDTWDYQWSFASWRLNGLVIQPALNQTRNLGFGENATHTKAEVPKYVLRSKPRLLTFPLTHPAAVERDAAADDAIDSQVLGINLANTLKRQLMAFPLLRQVASRVKALVNSAK
jgi:hypothetical protein